MNVEDGTRFVHVDRAGEDRVEGKVQSKQTQSRASLDKSLVIYPWMQHLKSLKSTIPPQEDEKVGTLAKGPSKTE